MNIKRLKGIVLKDAHVQGKREVVVPLICASVQSTNHEYRVRINGNDFVLVSKVQTTRSTALIILKYFVG